MILAHCDLCFPGSNNFPALASWVAGITGVHYHTSLIFVLLVVTGFHLVDQDGLDLLTSWSTRLGLPKCWDYRREQPRPAADILLISIILQRKFSCTNLILFPTSLSLFSQQITIPHCHCVDRDILVLSLTHNAGYSPLSGCFHFHKHYHMGWLSFFTQHSDLYAHPYWHKSIQFIPINHYIFHQISRIGRSNIAFTHPLFINV